MTRKKSKASLNKKGLVRLQSCVAGGEWSEWRKAFVQVDSRGGKLLWFHPSAKDKHEWEKHLWGEAQGSVVVDDKSTVEDAKARPFCIEIVDSQFRCRIATISDIDWGQWKMSLTGTLALATKRKMASTILQFKLRSAEALDIDSRIALLKEQIPCPCPRQLDLYTKEEFDEDGLGTFKFSFGGYGDFHLDKLEIASFWRHKFRFFFRLKTTDNSGQLFEVELMESDWENFEHIFIKMCCKLDLTVRRDMWSESKKAFWTQYDMEHVAR